MIKIKNNQEIELMRQAGIINYNTHQLLKDLIKVGISTEELNNQANTYIESCNAKASFKDYQGFPKSICTSLNDEVVHGIPSNYRLQDGDILKIDIGVEYKGYHSDSANTYIVGNTTEAKEHLLKATREALYEGIKMVKSGNYLGDISHAIETHAKLNNLGVVKELVGHGIGKDLHEDPNIPNYGKPKTGPKLESGMVLAIEPMLNLGTASIYIKNDGWTIKTADGNPSAHFEHTVLVTDNGYEILTGE